MLDLRPVKVPASKCPRCGRKYPRGDYDTCPSCEACDFETIDLVDDGEMEIRYQYGFPQIQPEDYTNNPTAGEPK